jgi:hypothetical protein
MHKHYARYMRIARGDLLEESKSVTEANLEATAHHSALANRDALAQGNPASLMRCCARLMS